MGESGPLKEDHLDVVFQFLFISKTCELKKMKCPSEGIMEAKVGAKNNEHWCFFVVLNEKDRSLLQMKASQWLCSPTTKIK